MTTQPTPPIQPAPPPIAQQKNAESFFQHVEAFFHKAEAFVSSAFEKVFGLSAAKQFAAGAEALIETDLGKIAMTAVTKAQALANNQEKFSQASTEILSQAKSAGIDVSDSIVNMLIELCVQRLKGSFATAG